MPDRFSIGRFIFPAIYAFLLGVLEKTRGGTWFFDGEFVVESW
jgi:hypothetical protein